jgi:hypothetical protein
MSAFLDRLLALLKWPVALLALVALPGLALALWGLLVGIAENPGPLLPFLGGFGAYLALWWLILQRPIAGSWLSTLEHELTHALFALLTFHRVVGLRATWRRGGEVRFLGEGNWLISVAPYFFPTFSALVMLAFALAPAGYLRLAAGLLGASVAYHLTSTLRETHRGQPDLVKVGFGFSLCLLPAANALALGVVLGYAGGGGAGALGFVRRAAAQSVALSERLLAQL